MKALWNAPALIQKSKRGRGPSRYCRPAKYPSENPEISAFLGTSRLTGPVDRYGAEAVFHGHAHHGTLQGKTEKGIPVYNDALPLLKRTSPDQRYLSMEV